MRLLETLLVATATCAAAYDLPDKLRQIYDKHKPGKCSNKLAGGFTNGGDDRSHSFAYCGDIPNAIFLHSQRNGGQYDNMDIDCDGSNMYGGKCSNDPTGQPETAFKDQVSQYGISDLDATIHPYVVFGNEGAVPNFDPQEYGMKPLSVMAVVCDGQVFYGVWGDTNGLTSTGEASISLAQLCFPNDNISGYNGHDQNDVLYIGFMGDYAVPGSSADWKANDTRAFEDSIKALGHKLVAGLTV